MIRKIIQIDEDRCNGCGACASACHEGAIAMVDGKARLIRDDYCDGLGDCLPACPVDAIHFVEREAAAYDEAAVKAHLARRGQEKPLACGCPGTHSRTLDRTDCRPERAEGQAAILSQLRQWPVQIKLAPVNATYFDGADLLIAATCSAFAYGDFHRDFIRGRITLVGCPKLDGVDYAEKLAEIIRNNDVKSVTVARMEVPCCGGLELMVKNALQSAGKWIPWQVVTISCAGEKLS